jgi:hypothetical protein
MVNADHLAVVRGASFMNHLVLLEAETGDLESILRGVKTMLARDSDPVRPTACPVTPGDSLYFLRDTDDGAVRVTATVARVLPLTGTTDEDLCRTLKEMQPRLQLTESQFNYWSTKPQVLLVEFESARKIDVIRVATYRIPERSVWIAFDAFRDITDQEVADENPTFTPGSRTGRSEI